MLDETSPLGQVRDMNLLNHSAALAIGATAGVLVERKLRQELPSPDEQQRELKAAKPGTRVHASYADITGKIAPLAITLSAAIGAGVLNTTTVAGTSGLTAALLAGGAVAGSTGIAALTTNGKAEDTLTTLGVLTAVGSVGFLIGKYTHPLGAPLLGTALFGAAIGMVTPWAVTKFAHEFTDGPEKPIVTK
jgi:hypothetical protein